MCYDLELSKIPFYQIHPEYMPYIGERYDAYRILFVGESHYIGQDKNEPPVFTTAYFMAHWWNGTCSELHEKYRGWYNTRDVINYYLEGNRRKGHIIFTNIAKSFSAVVLNQPIDSINDEESQKFNYFAFMNFFQMPSLFDGAGFWKSIENAENRDEVWNTAVEKSKEVLDAVIDIMEPQIVIFVSQQAYNAYQESDAKHKNDDNVKGDVAHPGSPWWNRRKKDGSCGKDLLETYLKQLKLEKP